ncbi:cyclin-like protein [Cystobasidium minutum MCA 4210]|uniref:cyclin-like protein n=1 Tax=Cystobasidium minutum MCA 4210 TaxID=1397322 RepID=UPI0034CEDA50|eukprot:jgi/Rhomi1/190077/estExt_fgenesh1_pg.C_4_t20244
MTAADGILNSPNSWLFQEDDLRYTPSRADGIPYEREMYERAFGVDLIVRVGAVRVDVPLLTIATASIFLHRFYMLQSLAKYKAREVALACLFLAGKVEESLRKVETVVNYCLRLEDRRRGKEPDVHPSSETFKRLVQQVLFVEEVVLTTLQFDLTVVHPHPLITRALKAYEHKLTKHEVSSLGRAAWQILSDIYTTPLCICYEAETLAASSFLLAYTLLSDVLPQSELPQNWTDQFDIDWSDEEDVQEVDTVVQRMLDIWTSGARNEKIQLAGNDLKQITPKATSYLKRKPEVPTSQEEPTQGTSTSGKAMEGAMSTAITADNDSNAVGSAQPSVSGEAAKQEPFVSPEVAHQQAADSTGLTGVTAEEERAADTSMQVDSESPKKEEYGERAPTPG